jgi:hypothetical protein
MEAGMRARGRRALTLAGVLLVLAAGCTPGGPRDRPTGQAAPTGAPPALPPGPAASAPPGARSAGRVLGVVWGGREGAESAELAWLDVLSLRPRPGRRLRLGRHGAAWAVAPDQSLALFAGGGDGNDGRLLVVDPRRLRRLGTIRLRQWWEWPYAWSWLGRSRVVLAGSGVSVGPDGQDQNAVVVTIVDPLGRRVLGQRRLAGELLASGRRPDGLVLLLGPPDRIGPARLVVVHVDGGIRSVRLPGIAAGFQQPADWSSGGASSRRASPGLAVDPAGDAAFVVAAGAPVARVDLDSLGVSWHRLGRRGGLLARLADWLLPAAEAKSVHGPVRLAAWLGGGLLAVWGHDDTAPVVRGSAVEQWRRPAGLQVIDTRSWTATTIEPNTSGAVVAGGRLLAFGRLVGPPAGPDANQAAARGYGLTIFGPGDRRPLHLLGDGQVIWLQVDGDRAYLDLTASSDLFTGPDPIAGDREVGVVDLEAGRVLTRWRGRLPRLLVGGCCDEPAGW